MEDSTRKVMIAVLIIASILAIYFLYTASTVNIIVRAVSAIVLLIVVGLIIQRSLELKGAYGFYMMGGKAGLTTMDKLSKNHRVFWDVMTVWGLTLGFGLLTYPLLKGKIDKRVYAFGVISIILILLFVTPYLSSATQQLINIAPIQNAIASRSASQQGPNLLSYISLIVTVVAGFSGYIFLALFANVESILYSIVLFLTNTSLGVAGSGLSSQIPGVAPVIPGIDIPLFGGIISLAILLIIHEFSHGVLARKAKVRLKSTGILVFGFIPIGGFVEPDEKMVNKLNAEKQNKIFSAGISANFIATIFFFALTFLLLTYVTPTAYNYKVIVTSTVPGYPANAVLKSGMQILKWNNYSFQNLTNINSAGSVLAAAKATDKPNSTVLITTNTGTYKIKAIPDSTNSSIGLIGVSLGYEPVMVTLYAKIVYFLYTVFALSMLLNFLVAVVNLLPLPGFDGWRIYKTNIKNEKFVNFLAALVIILIIINILPWAFYL